MDIIAPRFTDENAAREHLEAIQWPDGPFCPHCGSFNATRLEGTHHRAGLIQCNDCRQQFTVTVGTVFERFKVALNKWLLVNHLLCSSKMRPSRASMASTLPIGGLTNSPPDTFKPPRKIGERRKRWTH